MSDYQKRTPERLIEILRSSDQNPRSWNQEAADEIERLSAKVELARTKLNEISGMAVSKCDGDRAIRMGNAAHAASLELSSTNGRPTCKQCGLEDGACICRHLSPQENP